MELPPVSLHHDEALNHEVHLPHTINDHTIAVAQACLHQVEPSTGLQRRTRALTGQCQALPRPLSIAAPSKTRLDLLPRNQLLPQGSINRRDRHEGIVVTAQITRQRLSHRHARPPIRIRPSQPVVVVERGLHTRRPSTGGDRHVNSAPLPSRNRQPHCLDRRGTGEQASADPGYDHRGRDVLEKDDSSIETEVPACHERCDPPALGPSRL